MYSNFKFIMTLFIIIAMLMININSADEITIIDTHVHMEGDVISGGQSSPVFDYTKTIDGMIRTMNRYNVKKTVISSPPFPYGHKASYDHDTIKEAIGKNKVHFDYTGGGGILNPLIHKYANGRNIDDKVMEKFKKEALNIIKSGPVSFGEIALEHFSLKTNHPYIAIRPDNPLVLLLADIAAEYNMPLDIHMEAAARDMTVSDKIKGQGGSNPDIIKENINAFKKLLSHNPKAKIVWLHIGWDNSGDRTPALTKKLLEEFPNLYMSIKLDRTPYPANSLISENYAVKDEWLEVMKAFPDRFAIGSDQFYGSSDDEKSVKRIYNAYQFIKSLPADLAEKIAFENAVKIYNIK